MRWSRRWHTSVLAAVAIAASLMAVSCGPSEPDPPAPSSAPEISAPHAWFSEIGAQVGLDFMHDNGMQGELFLYEIMGSGVGTLDYDGDGDLDLYLVSGRGIAGKPRDRLFRQDRGASASTSRFVDVTVRAGIAPTGYGMGLTAADFDNDGWTDLYLTAFGDNQLYRNRGDGSFEDVTSRAGVEESRWSVSAAPFDLDGDGWLDLYVANYVDLTPETNKSCYTHVRDYCSPSSYRAVPDRIFRNRGDGSFEDATASSHLALAYGNGLGVVTGDFDLDGRVDLYVANDDTANQLWLNRGRGRLEETGMLAGCALNEDGDAEAGMGVVAGDLDGDGDEDLFLTHLRDQTNTLYLNQGNGLFSETTYKADLGSASRPYTGFGTGFFDFDLDGHLDLITINGAVALDPTREGDYPYDERNQIYRNLGQNRYREISAEGGEDFARSEIGRGAAGGDIDNDGDPDLLYSNVNGPARLLRNEASQDHHWLGLRLLDSRSGRDFLGASVEVVTADGLVLLRRVRTDGSYASANDPRLLVGLAEDARPVQVRVVWPGGGQGRYDAVPVDRWLTLRGPSNRAMGSHGS